MTELFLVVRDDGEKSHARPGFVIGTETVNADDLRLFLAVHRAGSIKGGARKLKLDHSSVSRRLATLEAALGARLFERTPEGLKETGLARSIFPLAERVENLTREIGEIVSAGTESLKGPVRIAVSPVMAQRFLMPRAPTLLARFPDVSFDLVASISRANLWQREADIAIRQYPPGTPPAEASAFALNVGTFGFAAYASAGYLERYGRPELPEQSLAHHMMIDTGEWGPGNAWNESLERPATYAMAAYPFAAALSAVVVGIGIAVLPCLAGDSDQRLVRLTSVLTAYDNWVVTRQGIHDNPRIGGVKAALVEMLEAAAPELAGNGPAHAVDAPE
jgi:DNA-binding transcriptional LysR family regulator